MEIPFEKKERKNGNLVVEFKFRWLYAKVHDQLFLVA